MTQKVKGNTKGLAPSQLRLVHKLFERKIDKGEIVTLSLAQEIHKTATALKRRVGALISREGKIVEVFVGTREILYLPELGRYRLGTGRLRRLRLIYSDLSSTKKSMSIPADIYGDLEKLRLDMVVGIRSYKNRIMLAYAHLLPYRGEDSLSVSTEFVSDLALYKFDFEGFITELENEINNQLQQIEGQSKSRAILVGVYPFKSASPELSMHELAELAQTAGVTVVDTVVQRRNPDPKTLLGKGKLEEVVLRCLRLGAEIIIFDGELRPTQWRIITNSTELKILDRSMLILDIFAQRARSSDGRLQVELAQLKYNLPRLVEKDAGLSRLTGGIGGRGPGETKLEIGRRRSRSRIRDLEKKLDKLGSHRSITRNKRKSSKTPLISILGYTNVGKSTLFNALTKSTVLVENKLFATLDPAQRRIALPFINTKTENGSEPHTIVLSDTVGFIRDLPKELQAAFKSTLEELYEAELLVHVIDASDPEVIVRMNAVESILNEMELSDAPRILVANKIDSASEDVLRELTNLYDAIPVSAIERAGFESLINKIWSEISDYYN